MAKMQNPYNNALVTPRLRLPDFLVKKETVSGIRGNTQGVTKAIKPPIKPNKKIEPKLFPVASSSPQLVTGFFTSIEGIRMRALEATPPSRATVKGCSY